jgi:Uma2 family endonuclease
MTALNVNLSSVIELTDEQFYQLCQANQDLRFERAATGELIIMPGEKPESQMLASLLNSGSGINGLN